MGYEGLRRAREVNKGGEGFGFRHGRVGNGSVPETALEIQAWAHVSGASNM